MIDRYRTDDAYLVTILLQIEGKWSCQGPVRSNPKIVVIGLHSAGKSCRRGRRTSHLMVGRISGHKAETREPGKEKLLSPELSGFI